MIAAVLTPGFVCEQTLAVESDPHERPNSNALFLTALVNSYQFDFQVRQRVTTGMSNYILAPIPIPALASARYILVHAALRLTCNHVGYAPLWREQLGCEWRELGKLQHSWPVLEGDDARWAVRATIDAVVADAYGLTRKQYAHILSAFSHRSYPKAPEVCLARFDELKTLGVEAFTRTYDPYWDIPLNDHLPQPVIDLPIPTEPSDEPGQTQLRLTADPSPQVQPRRRRSRRVS